MSVDRQRLVLIGAGSAVFTRGLLADLIGADDLGSWDIRLVDTDPEALRIAAELAARMVAHRGVGARIRVESSLDRRAMLPGADVVVTCVGVGGRPAWQLDHEIVQRHGVFQAVGDSILPGGISRLLRTTPVLVEIARDIADLAPEALFFNYSNPMTANIQAIARETGLPVVGLCHGVHHIQRELAALIDAPFERTSTLYAGINHLTFITDFRLDGEDAWPLIRARVERELREPAPPGTVGSIFYDEPTAWHNPFAWEFFAEHGVFAAAGDRHITEFFPERFRGGDYFGVKLGVDAFPLPEILEWGENRYQGMRRQATGEEALEDAIFARSGGEQEQLIAILRSVRRDSREMYSSNVINGGLVAGLPADAAVEVPAVATGRGMRAIAVPDLAPELVAILARRLESVSLGVDAALSGRRDLVIEAMLADGGVTDPDAAAALTDDLLAAQAAHLPRFR